MKAQPRFYFLLISQMTVSSSPLHGVGSCHVSSGHRDASNGLAVACSVPTPVVLTANALRHLSPLTGSSQGVPKGPGQRPFSKTLSAYADLPFPVSHLPQSHTQPLGLCHLPALSTGGPSSGSVLATWTHPLRPRFPSEAPTRGTKPRTHHSEVPAFLPLAPNT